MPRKCAQFFERVLDRPGTTRRCREKESGNEIRRGGIEDERRRNRVPFRRGQLKERRLWAWRPGAGLLVILIEVTEPSWPNCAATCVSCAAGICARNDGANRVSSLMGAPPIHAAICPARRASAAESALWAWPSVEHA